MVGLWGVERRMLRRTTTCGRLVGEPAEAFCRDRALAVGTNRFWAACLLTPMLRPMSGPRRSRAPGRVHEVSDEVVGHLAEVDGGQHRVRAVAAASEMGLP